MRGVWHLQSKEGAKGTAGPRALLRETWQAQGQSITREVNNSDPQCVSQPSQTFTSIIQVVKHRSVVQQLVSISSNFGV